MKFRHAVAVFENISISVFLVLFLYSLYVLYYGPFLPTDFLMTNSILLFSLLFLLFGLAPKFMSNIGDSRNEI